MLLRFDTSGRKSYNTPVKMVGRLLMAIAVAMLVAPYARGARRSSRAPAHEVREVPGGPVDTVNVSSVRRSYPIVRCPGGDIAVDAPPPRISTCRAVQLALDMDAESQQKEQRQLFDPYYYLYHPRLLPDEPVQIPYATKWVWIRLADYLSLHGVYWVHGFVGPDGVSYPQYGRRLNRVPGIEDPSEISDIGWERMLRRVPGVVVR